MKTKQQKYDYVIVGAGIAGLTLANQLIEGKKSVLIIERNKKVGGLARSFAYRYKGHKYIFDIGPKRFHTYDKTVLKFILAVLKKEYLYTGRKSAVHLFNRYFNWPVTTKDINKLPLRVQFLIVFDLLKKIINPTSKNEHNRFDIYIQSKYGNTLYNHFFKGYTEKFLGINSARVHSDWASASINRAIIDKKVKGNSIGDLLKELLLPQSVKTKFIYPKKKGFGLFCENLASQIKLKGGKLLLDSSIKKINYASSVITLEDKKIMYGQLIWTGNLLNLAKLLHEQFVGIHYLSTVFYNIIASHKLPRKDQWIYFGSNLLQMVRVTLPQNFAHYVSGKGKTLFIVERTCREKDNFWQTCVQHQQAMIDELVRVGLLNNSIQVDKIFVEPVADTYPVYDLNYQKSLAHVFAVIKKKYPKIKLLGRSGLFWYNNADHSIKAALEMAQQLLQNSAEAVDTKKIFAAA
jgi:protoporphyrinogen oxidase